MRKKRKKNFHYLKTWYISYEINLNYVQNKCLHIILKKTNYLSSYFLPFYKLKGNTQNIRYQFFKLTNKNIDIC